ncbi:hypothetical protein M8C21_031691, partial [Ambrosia artemisiifolia]
HHRTTYSNGTWTSTIPTTTPAAKRIKRDTPIIINNARYRKSTGVKYNRTTGFQVQQALQLYATERKRNCVVNEIIRSSFQELNMFGIGRRTAAAISLLQVFKRCCEWVGTCSEIKKLWTAASNFAPWPSKSGSSLELFDIDPHMSYKDGLQQAIQATFDVSCDLVAMPYPCATEKQL